MTGPTTPRPCADGHRLVVASRDGAPTEVTRDVLLAACVDIAIGLRPYIAEMS